MSSPVENKCAVSFNIAMQQLIKINHESLQKSYFLSYKRLKCLLI